MFPIIARLGPLALHAWGLMLALAFLAGIAIAYFRAKKRGVDPQHIVDLAVVVIIAAVIGGRLAYVLVHIGDFKDFPLEIFAVWRGGMTFYGGAVLGFIAGIVSLKRKRLNVWRVADIVAPSLSFGFFLGRIGCLLNGCCFGQPTSGTWGILFPLGSYAHQIYGASVRIHPTQVYSSFAGLVIFFLLLWMEKWWRFNGSLFWRYVILYSLWRIFIDTLRYYEPSSIYCIGNKQVTESQLVSVGMLILSIIMLFVLSRKKSHSSAGLVQPPPVASP